MKKRSIIPLIVSAALAFTALSACSGNSGGNQTTPTAAPGTTGTGAATTQAPANAQEPPADAQYLDTVVHQIGAQAITVLNPLVPASNVASHHWAFMMMYDRLVEWDYARDEAQPALATRWTISDDFKHFTFDLRDDVVFHNGDKFTAQDVANTYRMTQRPLETNGPAGEIRPFGATSRDVWSAVQTVNILGDYQIELVLADSNVEFLLDMASPAASILNMDAIVADDLNGPMIGTGAYKVENFISSDIVEFARNDDYWGTMPITKRQVWRFTPEAPVRTVMMQNGESHIGQSINASDVSAIFKPSADYNIITNVLSGGFGLFFNMSDPIAGDLNFRKAIFSAIDREAVTRLVEGEWAMPETTGAPWGWMTKYRNNSIPIIPRDINKAKEYLAASPYKGEELSMAAATFQQILIANIVQEQLREIGVTVKVEQMEMLAMNNLMAYGNLNGQMAVMMGQMEIGANSAYSTFVPEGGNNRTQYNNPAVTELLDKATVSTDEAERERLFKEVQAIVAEDPPFMLIYFRNNPVVIAAGFGGVTPPTDSDAWDLRNAYVIVK